MGRLRRLLLRAGDVHTRQRYACCELLSIISTAISITVCEVLQHQQIHMAVNLGRVHRKREKLTAAFWGPGRDKRMTFDD